MARLSGFVFYRAAALAVIALALVACGAPATADIPPTDEVSPSPSATPPALEPSPTRARDFAAINLCQLVTPEEVAALGGGTAEGDPNQQSEADYSMCWYEVTLASGAYSYYIVYMESADLGEAALATGDAGDPVPDLGDEAHVRFEASEDQFRLIVLRRGEYAFDMAGTDSDVMIEIARLLIERLGD